MLVKGDRVTHRDGDMLGTVTNVQEGAWSNGGQAMVTVLWDSGHESRVTHRHLSKV